MEAYKSSRSTIHQGTFDKIAPSLPDGLCSLAILDGPYNMRKADWDCFQSWDHFREWYRPHLEQVGRICKPSANLYVWGTDDSASALRELVESMGWRRKTRIIWDKGGSKADIGAAGMREWLDYTEVCDHYQRDEWNLDGGAGAEIADVAGADERNPMPAFFKSERLAARLNVKGLAAYFPSRTGGLTGCVSNWEGGSFPIWEHYQTCAKAMTEHGQHRDRPYLVHPSVWPGGDLRASYDHLRAEYDHLRAEYDHLRAEYEAARSPFFHPTGIGNVWRSPTVAGLARLKTGAGESHPCQKPLSFYDRLIRSSSRVGDVVLEPFGGTCRAAMACEELPASEARRAICIEPDPAYVDMVVKDLRSGVQSSMF